MLGFGLILLFIITVLVIRLISNNDTQSQLNETRNVSPEVVKEEILNKIDSNEEYQKVIDRKIALEESKNCTLRTGTAITSIEDVRDQNNDYNWLIHTEKETYATDYLVNSAGYKNTDLENDLNIDGISVQVGV